MATVIVCRGCGKPIGEIPSEPLGQLTKRLSVCSTCRGKEERISFILIENSLPRRHFNINPVVAYDLAKKDFKKQLEEIGFSQKSGSSSNRAHRFLKFDDDKK